MFLHNAALSRTIMAQPDTEKVKRTLSELQDEANEPLSCKPDDTTPAKRKKSVSSGLPEVFEMDELTHDQRLAAYLTIFQHCTPAMVTAALSECMRENIANSGWRAVWKPKGFSSFVLVQVCASSWSRRFHDQGSCGE